jgi:hypothetical protein
VVCEKKKQKQGTGGKIPTKSIDQPRKSTILFENITRERKKNHPKIENYIIKNLSKDCLKVVFSL